MDLKENGLQGTAAELLRYDRSGQHHPAMAAEGLLAEEARHDGLGGGDGSSVGSSGARMRSLSLDPHHPPPDHGGSVSEVMWQGGGEAAEDEERASGWRRDSYHQHREPGPSSWHGDNMRPPPLQPWDVAVNNGAGLREQAWRREAAAATAACSGRYEQVGFRGGEQGWHQEQQTTKEPDGQDVDPGWRLPNIPRRGQDAGWRHTEFMVSYCK